MRTLFAAALLSMSTMAAAQLQPRFIVFFPLWSGALDDAANGVIAQAAAQLKQGGSATITGYADVTGSRQANLFLSQLRAQRVIDGLVADGVPADHLSLATGGQQPGAGVADRRVEIAISR